MPTIFRDIVVINNVTFNDSLTLPDIPGVIKFGIDVLDGWKRGPDLDAQFTAIGSVDGEIPGEYFSALGRQLMVGGYVFAETRDAAELLEDVLVRDAFPRNVELLMTRFEPTPKIMRLRRNGPVETTWVGELGFRFGVDLRAPDPFKYAAFPAVGTAGVAGQSSGGRSYPRTYPLTYTSITSGADSQVAVLNEGSADSSRTLVTITGPLNRGGWRLVNETTNELIKFDVGLLSTDFLQIDFFDETALLNGSPITATITGDFFKMKPGTNIIKMYGDYDPSAGFTIESYSAWE